MENRVKLKLHYLILSCLVMSVSCVVLCCLVLCCVVLCFVVLSYSLFAGYRRIFLQICGKHTHTLFGFAAVLFLS